MKHFVEFRSLTLKPDTREKFHKNFFQNYTDIVLELDEVTVQGLRR
jgi:hypothetical protein